VTGRVIFTPPNPHNCQPGTERTPRAQPAEGGQRVLPCQPPYGSLWRCDQCRQVWEWVETREWVSWVPAPQQLAAEKPRWLVWSLVAFLVFALVVYGITEALT
jgi:hypothetical protein